MEIFIPVEISALYTELKKIAIIWKISTLVENLSTGLKYDSLE